MSGLLDLLCQIERCDKALGQSLRALLETIAEMYAKAEAEIKTVQRSRDYWHKRCQESEYQEMASARRNNADAEVGRLVRGMRPTTSLRTTSAPEEGKPAWVSFRWSATGWKRASTISINPAEALRAIQEVSDAVPPPEYIISNTFALLAKVTGSYALGSTDRSLKDGAVSVEE